MKSNNDPCKVNGTETEYFDCCNRPSIESTETESICNHIGTFNLIMLVAVFAGFVCVLSMRKFKFFKTWLFHGQQKILLIVAFFHVLTVTWRVILYLNSGHPGKGASATSYMIFKSSAVGDLGTSLTALCVFLRYFTQRYSILKENETLSIEEQRERFTQRAFGAGFLATFTYFAKAWMAVLVYFIFWGVLISRSLNIELNLEQQDKMMTGTLFLFTVVIFYQSHQLKEQIKQVMCEKYIDVSYMLKYFFGTLNIVLLAQTVLIPLTSSNLSPFPQKVGSEGWDGILEVQLFFDLSISAVIFSFAYVMFTIDMKAQKCIRNYEQQQSGFPSHSTSNNNSGSINESNTSFLSGNDKNNENGMSGGNQMI